MQNLYVNEHWLSAAETEEYTEVTMLKLSCVKQDNGVDPILTAPVHDTLGGTLVPDSTDMSVVPNCCRTG